MTMRPRRIVAATAAAIVAVGTTAWLAETAEAQDETDRGRAVYEYWCAPCHAPGPGHPGTQSLELKYDGSLPAVLLERTDLTPEAVKVFVRQGVLSMAPFRKTEITDADLDALAAYVTRK